MFETEPEWRQYVIDEASEYGLEAECLESYQRYLDAGENPSRAAFCALFDWDI